MHKLLIILNALVAQGTRWDPQHSAAVAKRVPATAHP